MTLTDRFLRAKHWQLFLLICAVPMIFQFVMMARVFSQFGNNDPDPSLFLSPFKFFPVVMIICMGTFFGWFWAIATGLQGKVPPDIKMKIKKFKIFFFIPMIYILIVSIAVSTVIGGMFEGGAEQNTSLIFSTMAIVFPLHLFSMFCIFYCLYFVAKTFKTVELQRETSFSDFAGEFFLMWFFPIGIWIIQPKINRMATSDLMS